MKAKVLLASAALCVSCAGPRNQLNTAASQCFRALPAARAAVGQKGALVGVHLVSSRALARAVPQAPAVEGRRVCTVAFEDDYRVGDLPQARAAGPGRYALVILDAHGSQPLAALVMDRLPRGLGHGAV